MIKKGDIYYADVTRVRGYTVGKRRPVLVCQSDVLNEAVNRGDYEDVLVMPLSTQLLGGDYRYFIRKRDRMKADSEVVCNVIGVVPIQRLLVDRGVLTRLTETELKDIDRLIMDLFGIVW